MTVNSNTETFDNVIKLYEQIDWEAVHITIIAGIILDQLEKEQKLKEDTK